MYVGKSGNDKYIYSHLAMWWAGGARNAELAAYSIGLACALVGGVLDHEEQVAMYLQVKDV